MLHNNQFESANLRYVSLEGKNFKDFETVLSRDNENSKLYNIGRESDDTKFSQGIERRFNLWSGRTKENKPYRCFLVYDKSNQILGYVNLGVSGIKDANLAEGGALFFPRVSDALIAEALNTVYIQYASTALSESGFIYTVSHKFESFYNQLKQSDLLEVNPQRNLSAEARRLLDSILQSSRFSVRKVNDINVLYESEEPIHLLYFMYSRSLVGPSGTSLNTDNSSAKVKGAAAAASFFVARHSMEGQEAASSVQR